MHAPPFVREITAEEAEPLLADWRWLVGRELTPLFLTRLGDWIFGAPDGSLWCLDMVEGELRRLAANAAEYNRLKASREWLDDELLAGWYDIAVGSGHVPDETECIAWTVPPRLGGPLAKSNLKKLSMRVYQSVMGQLHRQLRQGR
jgi:hypothetical protein